MREHGGDRREGRERRNDKRKQSAPASYLLHLSETVKGPLGSSHNEECHLRGGKEGSGARFLLLSCSLFSYYFTESCRPWRGKAMGSDGGGEAWEEVEGRGETVREFLRLRTVMNEEVAQRRNAASF